MPFERSDTRTPLNVNVPSSEYSLSQLTETVGLDIWMPSVRFVRYLAVCFSYLFLTFQMTRDRVA